jgi:predicted esterase YcpF (UPF0227 family)
MVNIFARREASSRAMKVIYLHGFASGPLSAKAVHVREGLERAGVACLVPDLNVPSFEQLRPSLAVERVAALVDGPVVVAGSSLGGLMALHVAARDERVRELVLVCPLSWPTSGGRACSAQAASSAGSDRARGPSTTS